MQYWLLKTEPKEYSFDNLLKDKKVIWDGIRNYQARNNLKKMQAYDKVLVYHTGENKEIVGIAEVLKESYQDPVDKSGTWVVVEIKAIAKLSKPFSLEQIKKEKTLLNMPLLKQSRLSVMPILKEEFDFILKNST